MNSILNIKFKTVEEYFSILPDDVRILMEKLRKTIKKSAPDAVELISYNMPSFKLKGMLVYYAAHKEHIGFYPANSKLILVFDEELRNLETSKGTIKLPYTKPLPLRLIKKIVQYRVIENLEKARIKENKKK